MRSRNQKRNISRKDAEAAKRSERKSKHEIRNSKQIQMNQKKRMFQTEPRIRRVLDFLLV
jgi:hypothetical protein